jgi:hypothetical protein
VKVCTRELGFSLRCATRAAGMMLALALCGCGDPRPAAPSVGTNSNWLRACATADQCDDDLPECECGACTRACAVDADCGELEDARCALDADPAAWAACESRAPSFGSGICLPRCQPGSCDDGQACVASACVLAPLPDLPFCAAVAAQDAALRAREEELLVLVQGMRAAGGVTCGTAPASTAAPALRFDARLVCAARVWAADIERTGAASGTDSEGRTGEDRLFEAGYTARAWGDSFAVDATDAARALTLMLADDDSCQRLTGAAYTDVGVGAAGQTLVVSIGAQ